MTVPRRRGRHQRLPRLPVACWSRRRSSRLGNEDWDDPVRLLLVLVVGRYRPRPSPPLARSSPSTSRTVTKNGSGPSCTMTSVGLASRLAYQLGCSGAPPFEATSAYEPSCSTRISAILRTLPDSRDASPRRSPGCLCRGVCWPRPTRALVRVHLVTNPLRSTRDILTFEGCHRRNVARSVDELSVAAAGGRGIRCASPTSCLVWASAVRHRASKLTGFDPQWRIHEEA